MSDKCSICGVFLPDYCINDVEITYKVNDQVVLRRKREVCPNCQSIIVQKITNSGFFPAELDVQCNPIPYDGKLGEHCPDCWTEKGELHENGCDWEKCPVCGLQLISCGHADQVQSLKSRGEGEP